jgi:hypothetical protein
MTLSTYDAVMRRGIFGTDGRIRLVIGERETSTDVEVPHDPAELWLLSAELSIR